MDWYATDSTEADNLRRESSLEIRFIVVMGFYGTQIGSMLSASVDILGGWIKR